MEPRVSFKIRKYKIPFINRWVVSWRVVTDSGHRANIFYNAFIGTLDKLQGLFVNEKENK